MKRLFLLAGCFVVLTLAVAAGVLADVVLHPGTLTGTIGFTGWTPTSTTVAIANGAFTGQTSADADGNFTLTVEGDQSYTAEYVTLFWGTRAYSSFTPTQSVFVPVGGTVHLNLRQPGATLAGDFPVTGGTLAGWALSVTGDGSPFTTSDSNDVSTFSVPIVAGTPYRVEATVQVNVADEFGGVLCSVPILFGPISQPAVSEGATNTLTLPVTVDASNCASGIVGTVALNGLPAGYQTGFALLNATSNAVVKSLTWDQENPHDYAFSLPPGTYTVSGFTFVEGPSRTVLGFPYRGTVEVSSGTTSRHDLILSSVVASGNLSFPGPAGMPSYTTQYLVGVSDSSLPDYGPTAQALSTIPMDATGHYSGIALPGRWTTEIHGGFSNAFGESGSTQIFSLVDYPRPEFVATEGAPFDLPDQSFPLSTGTIVFDVIEGAGEPEVGISGPTVSASLSDTAHSYSITGWSTATNAASPSVRLIGPPGRYSFGAYATVRGSFTQFASSNIDLGEVVDTPAGSGVIVVPKDSAGNPTPIQLEFATVTRSGTTTVSATDIGPAAPPDYNLLAIIEGNQYANLSTSAQFPDKIEIAVKYDPAALGLSAANEPRLALQQYMCNARGDCSWVVINEVYNPHDPAYTDADARYFGRSNEGNPDTANHIIYGVTDSLGTFGLTFPKVVLVPPTDSCVGSADGPAQLTTDASVCTATVDNLNQRAGGCSGGSGGLASCLFDGLAAEALLLGAHPVSIVGTAVDGSSASCTSYVAVVDREKPAVSCPPAAVIECTGRQTAYTAAATCGDNCGTCTASCGSGPFAVGTTAIDCNANDDSGNRNTCQTSVTVRDTTPPTLSLDASPKTLWPPNHKMVAITLTRTVLDLCDTAPALQCTAKSSECAPNPHPPDIVWTNGQLFLRAERNGDRHGRRYTIECTATDASGNRTVAQATVVVPHDQREGPERDGREDPERDGREGLERGGQEGPERDGRAGADACEP